MTSFTGLRIRFDDFTLEGCAGLREYRFIVNFIYPLPNHEANVLCPILSDVPINVQF